jgi:hypothetical protein
MATSSGSSDNLELIMVEQSDLIDATGQRIGRLDLSAAVTSFPGNIVRAVHRYPGSLVPALASRASTSPFASRVGAGSTERYEKRGPASGPAPLSQNV